MTWAVLTVEGSAMLGVGGGGLAKKFNTERCEQAKGRTLIAAEYLLCSRKRLLFAPLITGSMEGRGD